MNRASKRRPCHCAWLLSVVVTAALLTGCDYGSTDADRLLECILQRAGSGPGASECSDTPAVAYTVVIVPPGHWIVPRDAPLTAEQRTFLTAKDSELSANGAIVVFRSDERFSTVFNVSRYIEIPEGTVVSKAAGEPLRVRITSHGSRVQLTRVE